MTRLSTRYLGRELRTPVVASSSPLTGDLDSVRALVDAGVGAVVLPSLFEEAILHEARELEAMLERTAWSHPEAPEGYFPGIAEDEVGGPRRYLEHLEAVVDAVDVPVVASLNGVSTGGWLRYAEQLEDAGADAIELNAYRVAASLLDDPRRIEDDLVELVAEVSLAVQVPVAVKLSPAWTALGALADRLVHAGAEGLVLFNRFYQPDIDVETREVRPHLELSTPSEQLLPLRWTAVLHGRIDASLAITTGVHDAVGVAKALLVGADVAMMASALLRHGPDHVRTVLADLEAWMDEHGYASVEQLKGSASQRNVADPDAFERANYLQVLASWAGPARRAGLYPAG
jgi:dihydroorotate dehydrogenase (fumarate)